LTHAKRAAYSDYFAMIGGGPEPRLGDIIFSRNATVGEAAYVNTTQAFCMGQDVCLIRSDDQHQRFLLHHLESPAVSEQLEAFMIGSTFRRINVADIKEIMVALPPLKEQAAIADYCDGVFTKVNVLTETINACIKTLQEYRTALITAAVTGQIDVRDMV